MNIDIFDNFNQTFVDVDPLSANASHVKNIKPTPLTRSMGPPDVTLFDTVGFVYLPNPNVKISRIISQY